MSSTRIEFHIHAPRSVVYRALLDPDALVKWRVPGGMTSRLGWYTVGFPLFWAFATASSALTCYFQRSAAS